MPADHLVPTVDVTSPSSTELGALDAACRDHGFFLLTGHGLDDLVDATWEQARRFFGSDRSHRLAVRRDQDNPLGWFDRELTKRRRDTKQVYDFVDPADPGADAHNRWPDPSVFPDFRPTLAAYYDAFSELADRTTAIVHAALGLDDEVARRHRGDRVNSSVRLNHYPVDDPVPVDERDGLHVLGDTALGYHTDPGVITLLVQDDTGGLQTLAVDGSWVDVEPIPGTIVVNLADSVQVWTNDRYRAAVHRVVPMTATDRMSIPYFLHPARDAVIAPIPELAGAEPRYHPFEWRAFMRARTDDNFADIGADDAQIADYAIPVG